MSYFNGLINSKSKTVAENLRISQAMLSRFDLIFILMDKPNEEYDQILSEHVMGVSTSNWMIIVVLTLEI